MSQVIFQQESELDIKEAGRSNEDTCGQCLERVKVFLDLARVLTNYSHPFAAGFA